MANFKANPNEILAIGRKDATLAIEAFISPAPDGSGNLSEISPLKDSPVSRFVFTYIGKDGVRPTANLPIDEFPSVKKRNAISVEKLCDYQINGSTKTGKTSPAYTVKLPFSPHKGKTVAEVLKNPAEKASLLKMQSLLEANVSKFPANKEPIDAIKEGIALLDDGKLDDSAVVSAPSFEIYKSETKYKRQKDEAGRNLCYKLTITFNAGLNMPYSIIIENFFAPLDEKTKMIQLSMKTESIIREMKLTEKEFQNVVEKMKRTVTIFDNAHSEELWNRVLKGQYSNNK